LLQFIIRLEHEAKAAGGAVHPLLGNHDIQVFQKEYQTRKGKTLFKKYRVEGTDKAKIRDAFSGETELAEWLRERNAVIKIGPTIFTHAGLNVWALEHHLKRMNSTIRAWIRFWQGTDDKPERGTQWVALGPKLDWSSPSTGPLWTRGKKTVKKKNTAPDLDELSSLLKKYRAQRMVVGHAPVASEEILLSHPLYGSSVVMIDTRISDKKGGRLSCIEIRMKDVKAHYAKRNSAGEKIRALEMKKLKRKAV
jgi:RNase H-fold protein (predicted Holliday junction resolvase)